MTSTTEIIALTEGMSNERLVELAMEIADQANRKRGWPDDDSRAFTFVTTHHDSTFPHPVFLQKKLPTNKEARTMMIYVDMLDAGGESCRSQLVGISPDLFGRPIAYVRVGPGYSTKVCSWNSEQGKWQVDPD